MNIFILKPIMNYTRTTYFILESRALFKVCSESQARRLDWGTAGIVEARTRYEQSGT